MATNSNQFLTPIDNNQIVLNILQQEFPGLTELPSVTLAAETNASILPQYQTSNSELAQPLIPLDRSLTGIIQIDNDDDAKVLTIPLQKISFDDIDNYEEIIDRTYTYFVDLEDVPSEVQIPDIIGKFITVPRQTLPTTGGPTTDYHASYLIIKAFPNLLQFSVFFGKEVNGKPMLYRIPDYKTLEVMLTQRKLTYSAIQVIEKDMLDRITRRTLSNMLEPAELVQIDTIYSSTAINAPANANLDYFYYRYLPVHMSLVDQWSIYTRFESGYRPSTPYKRDPVDYIGQVFGSSLSTSFDRQTSLEKLRDKFEGRIVAFRDLNTLDALKGNSPFNGDNDDIEGLRMLFYGRWRPVFNLDILKLYSVQFNGPIDFLVDNNAGDDLTATDERQIIEFRAVLSKLIEAGLITVLNEDNNNSPIWNSFTHALTPLTRLEYEDYLKLTDVFDRNFLLPYEPRGSVRYYDAENNGARGSLLFPLNAEINSNVSAPSSKREALLIRVNNAISQIDDITDEIDVLSINNEESIANKLYNWRSTARDIILGGSLSYSWRVGPGNIIERNGNGVSSLNVYNAASAGALALVPIVGIGLAAETIAETNITVTDYITQISDWKNDYDNEYNQLIAISDATLSTSRTLLEDIASQIEDDMFITDFDNYETRINNRLADAVGIRVKIVDLKTIEASGIKLYTDFIYQLNQETSVIKARYNSIGKQLTISNVRNKLISNIDINNSYLTALN